MSEQGENVLIVGAGVAGCFTALRFAKLGVACTVVDHLRDADAYRGLCTHFIQPSTLRVMRELGVDVLLEEHGAVRSKAAYWSTAGWIDPPGGYSSDPDEEFGYTVERPMLDPVLRKRAREHPLIDLRMDHRITDIARSDAGDWFVELSGPRKERIVIRTHLLVAADGRASRVAKLLGNEPTHYPNERACYSCYYTGIDAPARNRSLFMAHAGEMLFIYPVAQNRTLLASYVAKERLSSGQAPDTPKKLLSYTESFAPSVSMATATPASRISGYRNYPNLRREVVFQGVPFVGDSALTLDPMSGVGCGFAMIAGHLLANHTAEAVLNHTDVSTGLKEYRRAFESYFGPHARGICAESRTGNSVQTTALLKMIGASLELQNGFIALTGRLISPAQFQRMCWHVMAVDDRARSMHTK